MPAEVGLLDGEPDNVYRCRPYHVEKLFIAVEGHAVGEVDPVDHNPGVRAVGFQTDDVSVRPPIGDGVLDIGAGRADRGPHDARTVDEDVVQPLEGSSVDLVGQENPDVASCRIELLQLPEPEVGYEKPS